MPKIKLPSKTNNAIIGIVIIECFAIWQGINGALLGIAIAAVAGLGGYELGFRRKPK